MINNIIVVFCEGGHDIAFLTRLLLCSDYVDYGRKVSEFITPFNKQFSKELSSINLSEKKLGDIGASYKVPSVALAKDDCLVFIHNLKGDGRLVERTALKDLYTNIVGEDDFSAEFNFNFKFLYFFDADEVGVTTRLNNLTTELALETNLTNGSVVQNRDGHKFGSYIFHNIESADGHGDLEDVIFTLIKQNEEALFSLTDGFIKGNLLNSDRQRELRILNGTEVYDPRNKFKVKKSILNTLGQFQFSGSSNVVIIKNSDYFKKTDILGSDICSTIIGMFSNH